MMELLIGTVSWLAAFGFICGNHRRHVSLTAGQTELPRGEPRWRRRGASPTQSLGIATAPEIGAAPDFQTQVIP